MQIRRSALQQLSSLMALSALVFSLPFCSVAQENTEPTYNLMLAGGALKTCSSTTIKYCQEDRFDDNARKHSLFKISSDNIAKFTRSDIFKQQPRSIKEKFNAIFSDFYADRNDHATSMGELAEQLSSATSKFDVEDFILGLPDPIYNALHDFFEVRSDKSEIVDLSNNKSTAVKQIYIAFLEQAILKHKVAGKSSKEPVHIGIITASSRDALSSAEFYQKALESAARIGFPDVNFYIEWLPLDISLATVLRGKQNNTAKCEQLENVRAQHLSFNRPEIYPELIKQQQQICQEPEKLLASLRSISGLFLNGGDQNRTRNTLINSDGSDSDWLAIIHQKLRDNHLILAGTSAGTAVQSGGISNGRPIPMITSGDTFTAMFRGAFALAPPPYGCEATQNCPYGLLESDLTFNPKGGINTFNLGILDTHFSERDRQGRLALLAAATKTPYGFGIDEATALFVNTNDARHIDMKVLGEGGVFIVSMHNGIYKSQSSKHQLVGISHYLTSGDKFRYTLASQDFDFFFSDSKTVTESQINIAAPEKGRWRKEVASICGASAFHRWNEDDIAFLVNPSDDTVFYVDADSDNPACSYVNLMFGIEN